MSIKHYGMAKLRSVLRNGGYFVDVYARFLRDEALTDQEKRYLLRIAITCLSMADRDKDSAYFGYSIVVHYANRTKNYRALYDVALAHNYMPIVNLIERIGEVKVTEEGLHDLFVGSLKSAFYDERANTYKSEGQLELASFMSSTENVAVVAPTSYGKSEIIIDSVKSAQTLQKNVCIVVPTKALVSQTKKRLYERGIKRVITHPDMYNSRLYEVTGFVSVLTQERVLSLFTRNKGLALDLVFVDEAHNILDKDERSVLLSQVLLIARKRNANVEVNYFTPFLANTENLTIIEGKAPRGFLADERMKVERYFYRQRTGRATYIYDQFLDMSFPYNDSERLSAAEFVIENGSDKNIIYLNSPREVSRFATDLASGLPDVPASKELKEAMVAIADYTNPLYNIIACLKKGVLFHHGGMPDAVKLYVEDLYSMRALSIKYLVTTSTLLEGVNIPASRLFIVNSSIGNGALSDSQLKNLAGRVGRYRELFSPDARDAALLEPKVYLVNDGEYERGTLGSPENFYSSRVRVGKKVTDKVENPLLEKAVGVEPEKLQKEIAYLLNVEEGLSLLGKTVDFAQTAIGRACFEHNVRDFNIILSEQKLEENLDRYSDRLGSDQIGSTSALFEAIVAIFARDIALTEFSPSYFIASFDGVRAQHSWFLEQCIARPSLNYLINVILFSWRNFTTPVFVGGMGDVDKEGKSNGMNTNYAYVNRKNQSEKVSLAISKIKVNQDVLENCIMKYLEVLHDLGLVEEGYYNQVKYHTTDSFIISLLKQGASHELAQLLATKYREHILIDESEIVKCIGGKENFLDLLRTNKENDIIIFELKNFI